MTYLNANHVSKSYGGTVALRDVSLEIQRGTILALLGPNGAGKTTLIKIFATLLKKDAGQVQILGRDLDADEQQIRHLFGYVGQDTDRSAYARLTVRENLRFFGALRGLSSVRIEKRIQELAEQFDFTSKLDQLHMVLSGGEKQVVVIIRAFLPNPALVYLDEPTKGLDPFMAKKIRAFVSRYVREGGNSVLLTSHILSEVDELAHEVALIHEGAIAIRGTSAGLKESLGLQGILEIPADVVTEAVESDLAKLNVMRMSAGPAQEWIPYSVDSGLPVDSVFRLLGQHQIGSQYRYRPISLEDAFVYQIGRLEERFEG